jgi:hypothetical protein
MAGNDGDLLKQATQRMMARYEGELHLHLSFAVLGVMTTHDSCSTICLELERQCPDGWDRLSPGGLCSFVSSGSLLYTASFRTCLERQGDEGSRQ